MTAMQSIEQTPLQADQAALWFLGQAGYVIRSAGVTVAIDPYLTDSIRATAPDFGRCCPVPLEPEDLRVDLFLVTHDHADHLDPETLKRYPAKETTQFVAPRLAAKKLMKLGVSRAQITILNTGETTEVKGVTLSGIFALPTSIDVLDTTGYLIRFANGRSLYHTSDTGYASLLLQAAPREVDVLLVPINGKWGNLNLEQAVELTKTVSARYVLPNHYDLMTLNSENPLSFDWYCRKQGLSCLCVIPAVMKPFVWH